MAYLPTLPRVRLVIVGAGHVGQAVAELAARGRLRRLGRRRPPAVRQRRAIPARPDGSSSGPIDEVLPALEITPQTYALIVTRGHGHDQEALYHLAPTPALVRRPDRQPAEDQADLREPARARGSPRRPWRGCRAPVGLDIGSQTVPEIAVSIVAELIARRNRGPGGVEALEDGATGGPRHDRRDRPRRRPERADGPAQADPADGGVTHRPSRSARSEMGGAAPVVVVVAPGRFPPEALAHEAARAGGESSSPPRRRPTCGPRSSWGSTPLAGGPPSAVLLAPGDSPD